MPVTLRLKTALGPFIAAILCGLLVPALAGAEELFRYRFQTKDGRQFQYVFESSTDPLRTLSPKRRRPGSLRIGWQRFTICSLAVLSTQNSTKSHFRTGLSALQIRLVG
jgi:hypothetical protein